MANRSQLQRLTITPSQCQGVQIRLTSDQEHYLLRVLRLGKGDRFIALLAEVGEAWIAQITDEGAMLSQPLEGNRELPVALSLMVALPKGNGFEEIVRCCTELGVVEFIPVISDRTLLKPSPQKVTRWRKIAQEAAEQSERIVIPTLWDPLPLKAALTPLDLNSKLGYWALARGADQHLMHHLIHNTPSESIPEIILATGPEGGWTASEVAQAREKGFQVISLGERILRAVTAPIVAASLLAAWYEQGKQP
ncbi:16S rRNA (uracil(1498)-N(3))-methyltransferase [Spirulina subsalsa FACHB-351]|uniref:Ribosomal RNA small subunit methyltransferase E n=1 Tax=Spirulina subsalsa FACHB-351 TaxID=234711 RepID=A0ABT3L6L0_9CYAN|nr:16S rRNA (uracil(1498)-N(3))-methyltransferase [Spirulina subsalsa]MCW6036625.1 16S rRNA (uracil(1498)-N(3))-methyltransferase [Spirulina subsalsa FACHB-351]